MQYFSNAHEAKEFLVAQIVNEAQSEGAPLSEIERKMLFFTESGRTLPDMADVYDKFDEEYDQDEYEAKIAKLVRSAVSRVKKASGEEYDRWWDAIHILKTEDHYISVLISRANLRLRGDLLKLWGSALAIVSVVLLFSFLSTEYNIDWSKYFPNHDALQRLIWGTLACLAALYIAARLLFGARVDDWIFNSISRRFQKQDKPKR
jgi:hypothetical protein